MAQFGDGYMQRVGDGINNTPRQWQLQFKGSQQYIEEIDSFPVTLLTSRLTSSLNSVVTTDVSIQRSGGSRMD